MKDTNFISLKRSNLLDWSLAQLLSPNVQVMSNDNVFQLKLMMPVRSSIFFLVEAFAISRNIMNHKISKKITITFYRFLLQMSRKFGSVTWSLSPLSECIFASEQGSIVCLFALPLLIFAQQKNILLATGLCRQISIFISGKWRPRPNSFII